MSIQLGLYFQGELVAIWPHNEQGAAELRNLLWHDNVLVDEQGRVGCDFETKPMEVSSKPKQQLYTTAYSLLFETFVAIQRAFTDDRGEWIFVCDGEAGSGINEHLFREIELIRFCL